MTSIVEQFPERAFRVRRDRYRRMIDAGVFEGMRAELIHGEIVPLSPQNSGHSSTIRRLTHLLVRALGDRAYVRVQLPLTAPDDSEPEPDLAVVLPEDDSADHPSTAFARH